MFEGFVTKKIKTSQIEVNLKIAGNGPPLLLLHGYPQTHVIWHKIAPRLAEKFTVVTPDLRGYGDSGKPATTTDHAPYSKRVMALDQVEVMQQLGFDKFAVVGHDRGGRVAHRMVRDHPERIEKIAVLDIAPTEHVFSNTNQILATTYYHWFFLIQPNGLPEKMIGNDPEFYLQTKLKSWGKTDSAITQAAYDEYLRCFAKPETIHSTCEDYRAAANIDLEHDAQNKGEKIDQPLLVLWGSDGFVGNHYDILQTWRDVAHNVSGHGVNGGHYVPEEAPEETLQALLNFL